MLRINQTRHKKLITMDPKSIDDILSKKLLLELRRLFYKATGMTISFIIGRRGGDMDFFPKSERSNFCKIIHSTPQGKARCFLSDSEAIQIAFKNKKPHIYECHGGLVNVAVPIIMQNKLLGSILSGQIVAKKPTNMSFLSVKEKTKELRINYDKLKEAYKKVKIVPREKVDIVVKLLFLIANFIVEKESVIVLQKELIHQQKKIVEANKEREQWKKELRKAMPFIEMETVSTREHSRHEKIIMEAKRFIETNFTKTLNLKDVAEAVYLSPNYFSNLFKHYTNYTFHEYLMKIRIENAKELLSRLNLNVSQVSNLVGYDDPNHFSKVFTKITGYSPQKYRQNFLG
ncbi:MAG: PocR ligand-binding domain-containing protein [bacterium]|nr:PocR ligand-binding domain-containing protein [bacterium]